MTDIHTHILHEIDDGPGSIQESIAILKRQFDAGINRVILTPHFYPSNCASSVFLQERQERFWQLTEATAGMQLPELKLGAEVHYTQNIQDLDIPALTLGGSRYLLLELPYEYIPPYFEKNIYQLVLSGFIPVLAHVERYSALLQRTDMLESLIQAGALIQVSESSARERWAWRNIKKLCKQGLIHLVASDIHSGSGIILGQGKLRKLMNEECIETIRVYADMLWRDEPIYL